VFVSSHLLSEMQVTADHLVVIGHGRLVADAPLDEIIGGHASLEDAYYRLTEGSVAR
jgi:ABC-2 type transport system ATP-binding protein